MGVSPGGGLSPDPGSFDISSLRPLGSVTIPPGLAFYEEFVDPTNICDLAYQELYIFKDPMGNPIIAASP